MATRVEGLRHNWLRVVASQPGGKSSEPLEVRREQAIQMVDKTYVVLYGHRDDWPEIREELIEKLSNAAPLSDSDPEETLRVIEKLLGRHHRSEQ